MMPALPIEGYDTTREDGVTRIRPVYAAPLPVEAVSSQEYAIPQEPPALPVELPVAQPSGILADVDRALSGAVRAPFDALDERLFGKSGKKGTYREAIQKFFKTGPSDEVKTGINRLLGTGGEERYKTWPEKLVVDAITAPGNVLKSENPVSTEELIKPALDVSNLAGTGGLAGVGSGAGVALGSGPIRQAVTVLTKSEKPFYSALERSLGSINQNKASGEQWLGMLANKGGVKPDELQWSGVGEFLAGKPSVTKAEIDSFLKDNPFGVQEVVKGAGRGIDPDEALKLIEKGEDVWLRDRSRPNDEMTGPLDADDILAMRNDGNLEFHKTDAAGDTKYHDYQLPGGENYREVLMTLPSKKVTEITPEQFRAGAIRLYGEKYADSLSPAQQEIVRRNLRGEHDGTTANDYRSSHWDEPNILAHMRMNDRTIDGKKSLHLEEIQSDWHQAGRKSGYKSDGDLNKWKELDASLSTEKEALAALVRNTAYQVLGMSYQKFLSTKPTPEAKEAALAKLKQARQNDPSYIAQEKKVAELEAARNAVSPAGKVPDAPFKKNWHELALKRAIREAAENGYERLSWTPGEAQAARYDLSKQVDQIKYLKNDDGTYNIVPFKNNAPMHAIEREAVSADKLADIVGKEVAEKIIKDQGKREGKDIGVLEGIDLKVGGEGMKGFYDNIVPKTIEKLGKQFGVKVQTGKSGKHTIYYIDIPPAMRDKVLAEGYPLFSANLPIVSANETDNK